jgi:hypothetical protein
MFLIHLSIYLFLTINILSIGLNYIAIALNNKTLFLLRDLSDKRAYLYLKIFLLS